MELDNSETFTYGSLHDLRKGTLTKIKKDDLKKRLEDASVPFVKSAKKPELQALCALIQQGVLLRGHAPDQVLLGKVIGWIKEPVSHLKDELKKRKLDFTGQKWDHIENLIAAELDREESALENVHLSSVCGRSSKTLPADKLVHTHPKVANLQGALKERSEVEKMLGSPDTEAGELLSWMFKNCGNDVIVASDHFEIRGMSKPVDQFLLIKPDKKRHQTFLNGMKKALSKSILLFHGTPLSNLYPILRDGFTPSYDERFGLGNFMAEEPKLSYDFAFKEAASYRRYKASEKLESYSGWGVLLGCEVPGNGRPVEDYTNSIPSGVHVIEDLASIAIRYIFLLPPPYAPQKMPARAVIRAQMMEAFQRFPADLP